MFKYSLLFLFLIGCADSEIEKDALVIDPAFEPYVDSFYDDAVKHGAQFQLFDTSVVFVDYIPVTNSVGLCKRDLKGNRILILRSWWESHPNHWDREVVMYHELAHCSLGRMSHNNTVNSLGLPLSILNQYIINSSTYRNNKQAYMKELFTLNMEGPWL